MTSASQSNRWVGLIRCFEVWEAGERITHPSFYAFFSVGSTLSEVSIS